MPAALYAKAVDGYATRELHAHARPRMHAALAHLRDLLLQCCDRGLRAAQPLRERVCRGLLRAGRARHQQHRGYPPRPANDFS